MSCNGCRVLRKGCGDNCVLRQCLTSIDGSHAQGHATLFVAKFFGRAALLSFISAVPLSQRPALFQSLLYEAVGRTINPVGGVVGLLWTGNWQLCQAAAESVLQGGALRPLAESHGGFLPSDADNCSESVVDDSQKNMSALKRRRSVDCCNVERQCDLDLSLMPAAVAQEKPLKKRRSTTASCEGGSWSSSSDSSSEGKDRKLLRLFV